MAAAGKQSHHQQQQEQEGVVAAAAATEQPSVARRLWRVVRAVLYMLRRGLPSGRKLAMDLHLLLHRGKVIAGKALGDRFLSSHHHGRHAAAAFSYASGGGSARAGGGPFSCGALDPSLAVHEPSRRRREVEFSCSNTPSSTLGGGGGLLGAARRRRRRRRRQQHRDEAEASNGYLMQYYYSGGYGYDAAEVARVFEMLSDDEYDDGRRLFSADAAPTPGAASSATTPSPAQAQLLRLAGIRQGPQQQPRITAAGSSPAPDGGAAAQVDRRADEFIRRFYEQLRAQRSATSTPDYYGYAAAGAPVASPYAVTPRAPRPVTAGIA